MIINSRITSLAVLLATFVGGAALYSALPFGGSTDNAIARFDGTGGDDIQNSLIIIDDAGNLDMSSGLDFILGGGSHKLHLDDGATDANFLIEAVTDQINIVAGNTTLAIFDGSGPNKITLNAPVETQTLVASGLVELQEGAKVAQGKRVDFDTDLDSSIRGSADDTLVIEAGGTDQVTITNGTVDITASLELNGRPFSNEILEPIGLYAANLTNVTSVTNRTVYWLYVGRAASSLSSMDIRCEVTTAYQSGGPGTYAEVGVATGNFVSGGGSLLTVRGQTNVATTFNTTGLKTTAISLTGVSAGDDLWVGYGCRATLMLFELRAVLADQLQSGVVTGRVNERISTWSAGTAATITTEVPAWIRGII